MWCGLKEKMRSNTGGEESLLCSTIRRWAVHQPQQAFTQDSAAKCVQQTGSWITFSVDTQYGAPVITACQCVQHRWFGAFLGSHIKAVVATVSASEACNTRKPPGVSEDPMNLPSAHRHLMIRVEVCNMTPSWKSNRHNNSLPVCAVCSLQQRSRVRSDHFDKLTVVCTIND